MRKALSVVALLAFTSAHAQWIDKQGNRLTDTDDRKSSGSFGAEIVFTTNAEVLEERWRTPSETVSIDSVDHVRINAGDGRWPLQCGFRSHQSADRLSSRDRGYEPRKYGRPTVCWQQPVDPVCRQATA